MRFQTYTRRVSLPVAPGEAFAWHARPGALLRLLPPWQNVRVVRVDPGINDGTRVELEIRVGPAPARWIAEHRACRPPDEFRDVQIRGPMAYWEHAHRFESSGADQCSLEDRIEYALPLGAVGRALDAVWLRDQLDRMFTYRHATTVADLTDHARFAEEPRLKIGVSGSSGLIGSALVPFLSAGGHDVHPLVRGEADTAAGQLPLPVPGRQVAPEAFEGLDAIVHLAGENVAAGRWTNQRRRRILESRVEPTRRLCELLARADQPPHVLVCASAIGFYGSGLKEPVDEDSPPGDGFLADVCRQWEAATEPARAAGIRVVPARFGMVLSPRGGALAAMLRPFRLGVGGPLGDGSQMWSWISIDDAVAAIHHAIMCENLNEPVNVTSPGCVSNREFSQTLARVLKRPAFCRVPRMALQSLMGAMADELLLGGVQAVPHRLVAAGYVFRHALLEDALRHLLGMTDPCAPAVEQSPVWIGES